MKSESGVPDRWFILALMGTSYFVLYLDRNLLNFIQEPLIADLQLSDQQLGFLHQGFLFAYAIAQIFVGWLSDRFQRRTVLLLSLTLSSFCLAAMGLCNSFAELFALRCLLAITQSPSVPAIAGIMADCFTAKMRSRSVSIYLLSSPISIMVAAIGGGYIAEEFGWREAFYTCGGLGLLYVILLFCLLREPARTERAQQDGLGEAGGSLGKTLLSILTIPQFWLLAIAYILVANVTQLVLFWLPRHLQLQFELGPTDAGAMASWVQMGTVLGLFCGGYLADYWCRHWQGGRVGTQLLGLVVTIPTLLIVASTNGPNVMRVALFLFGMFSWLYFSNLWATTFDAVDPAARSTAIGLLNVSSGMFGSWVSPLVGRLRDAGVITGFSFAFYLGAGMTLVAILLLVCLTVTLRSNQLGETKA